MLDADDNWNIPFDAKTFGDASDKLMANVCCWVMWCSSNQINCLMIKSMCTVDEKGNNTSS